MRENRSLLDQESSAYVIVMLPLLDAARVPIPLHIQNPDPFPPQYSSQTSAGVDTEYMCTSAFVAF